MTVPNGPADVATFPPSSTSSPFISANTEVNAIAFPVNSGYAITVNPSVTLTLSGTGVIGTAQFVTDHDAFRQGARIVFSNRSTAGNATVILNQGIATFADNSTAGNANIDVSEGGIGFLDSSTADNAHISGIEGLLEFSGSSTAGNADIGISDLRSSIIFRDTSSAGNATIVGGAGRFFYGSSTRATRGSRFLAKASVFSTLPKVAKHRLSLISTLSGEQVRYST
jgi:hypothetical protein